MGRCKDLDNNRLQRNLGSPILDSSKMVSNCFSEKGMRTRHQYWIAKAHFMLASGAQLVPRAAL